MNGEFLYEAMGGISPIHVYEAEMADFPRPAWRTLVSVAACLAVMAAIYVGLPALLYEGPAVSAPELAAPSQVPSMVGSPPPAAETAAEYLRSSPWLNLGSLLLGLAAWVLPLAGWRKKHAALPLASFAACALALLLQVCSVLHRVNTGDFTTLADTMPFIMAAAVVMMAGTLVLNLAVSLKWRVGKR